MTHSGSFWVIMVTRNTDELYGLYFFFQIHIATKATTKCFIVGNTQLKPQSRHDTKRIHYKSYPQIICSIRVSTWLWVNTEAWWGSNNIISTLYCIYVVTLPPSPLRWLSCISFNFFSRYFSTKINIQKHASR